MKLNPFPPQYLRPEAAAAHIGVSRRQLELWAKAGKIREPYRPSRMIAVFERVKLERDMDALCGHIAEQEQSPGRMTWQKAHEMAQKERLERGS